MEKNNWFVANDAGKVAGSDMSETKAKLLASELADKITYYIAYSGSSGDGYVGYDNEPCDSLDNAMEFDSEKEAADTMTELQKEWASKLSLEHYQDLSWEAMNSDED